MMIYLKLLHFGVNIPLKQMAPFTSLRYYFGLIADSFRYHKIRLNLFSYFKARFANNEN